MSDTSPDDESNEVVRREAFRLVREPWCCKETQLRNHQRHKHKHSLWMTIKKHLCPIREKTVCLFLVCRASNRAEESDEMSYMKELTPVSEPTQIQLGLL